MKNIYLLKDIAQLTGHSVHTLKYYLRFGLLKEMGRSPATNFRYFDDLTVERLRQIRKMRLQKLSLLQIKEALPLEMDYA
jgi:DNA-binding transcriptional MerR regulator